MMKLIDVLRLYAIDNDSEDMRLLLKDIFTAATLDSRLDYDVLADEIIRDSGASVVRYPNTTVFAELGTRYLQSRATEIVKKLDLIYSVYDPLENYSKSRTEVLDRDSSGQRSETRTDNLTEMRTDNLSEIEEVAENVQHSNARMDTTTKQNSTTTTPSTTETSTHSVSADDESTLQLRTQDGLTRSGTETESGSASESNSSSVTGADETQAVTTTRNSGTQTTANSGTQTKAGTHSDSTDESRTITERGRTEAGQDLLLRQLELLKQLNVYSWIADSFGRTMCLNVW